MIKVNNQGEIEVSCEQCGREALLSSVDSAPLVEYTLRAFGWTEVNTNKCICQECENKIYRQAAKEVENA